MDVCLGLSTMLDYLPLRKPTCIMLCY